MTALAVANLRRGASPVIERTEFLLRDTLKSEVPAGARIHITRPRLLVSHAPASMLSTRALSLGVLLATLATAAHAQAPSEGSYSLSVVEVQPEVANRREIAELVRREYPAALQGSGTVGTVTLRFAVDPRGRVDANTITVLSTSGEAFNEPARRVAQRMRFRPAMIRDKPVRVMVELPIRFTPDAG